MDFLVYESRRRLLASLATVWQYAELELSWNIEEIITGHRLVLPSGVVRPEGGEKLSTVVDYLNWLGAQGWECFESAVLAGGYNRVGVLRMRFKRPQAVAAESDPIAFRP